MRLDDVTRGSNSFSHEIKGIATEQIDNALDCLKQSSRNYDEGIHEARVCIKKIRALLRLVQDSLGPDSYASEDKAYRDTARILSKIRDSAAMLEITDTLVNHFSEQLSKRAFANVRKTLASSKSAKQSRQKSAMSEAAKQLRKARRRIQSWPKAKHTVALSKGLKRVFKQGRDQFSLAYDDPSIDTFHEWRKQVKHLLYQSKVLTPLWCNTMKTLSGELKTLGKYLSEDHDLGILRDVVIKQLEDTNDRTEIEAFVALIDQRRNELQEEARVLGLRIYADKPRAFALRAEAYWRAWRADRKTDPISVG
jgi:CHAD domain-containing protein